MDATTGARLPPEPHFEPRRPRFVVAMAAERRSLGRWARCTTCGVGPQRAAAAAERHVREGADLLVSFGVAGGLGPQAPAGTLLLPDAVLWQGRRHACATVLRDRLRARLAARQAVLQGVHLALPYMVLERAHRRVLARSDGAVGVDMESGAVAAVAERHGVALLIVRAVCDDADTDIRGDVAALLSGQGSARLAAAGGLLLRRPGSAAELYRLSAAYRQALRTLAEAGRTLRQLLNPAAAEAARARSTPS